MIQPGLPTEPDLPGLFATLKRLCGSDALVLDPTALVAARHDVYATGVQPLAILAPREADTLGPAIAAITAQGLAVVPRGGGLSYTAGYVLPVGQAVLVDLSRLDRILAIDPVNMTVTVEAGATWKAIHAALAVHDLRLPFFGTFSGAGATVGGGLSHGALFFGSARYGSAADILLSMDVVLADGSVLSTGQAALRANCHPVFRGFGPDLGGLFLHDGGAFGIKARATLRVMRRPAHTGCASFAFSRIDDAVTTLCAIQREGLIEDGYIMDPGATDHLDIDAAGMARSVHAVARNASGVLTAARSLLDMARSGRGVIPKGHFSLHLVCAERTHAGMRAALAECALIARGQRGQTVAATIPMVARADPFPGLNGALGPGGGRWAALNAKVALGEAQRLVAAFDQLIAQVAEEMDRHDVRVTRLASALATPCFSFEGVFHWRDSWLPLHHSAPDAAHIARLAEPAANPAARALVERLREMTVALFHDHGAASNQIGRTYPFLSALRDEPAAVLRAIKQAVDPRNLMNPGVLGFRPGSA